MARVTTCTPASCKVITCYSPIKVENEHPIINGIYGILFACFPAVSIRITNQIKWERWGSRPKCRTCMQDSRCHHLWLRAFHTWELTVWTQRTHASVLCHRWRPGQEWTWATIAGFWHLAQDAQLNILKSKLAQDVSLETPSLPSAAGDEARRNFLLKDVPGARSNTPPADRPMGAMTPPARPATLSAEGMGIDANPQPVTHGLDLAGKRFSTGLGPGLTY